MIGSVVYSYFDMAYDTIGYAWLSLNTSLFALNVLYEKHAVVTVDQTAVGISCYQNLLSLPLLVAGCIHSGELGLAYDTWFNLSMQLQVRSNT